MSDDSQLPPVRSEAEKSFSLPVIQPASDPAQTAGEPKRDDCGSCENYLNGTCSGAQCGSASTLG